MQQELFNSQLETRNSKPQPVTCLGIEFPSDEARRQHFTGLLRERLRDPEFRKIEGFPIGSDEAILKLSDPPYYTACPNPWIADFIAEWEAQKPEGPEGYHYHREPFAADVSEGKNNAIYNAHSYHTKVPHKAIMRYILHYTNPGDIVLDGFCGTGMTGVAAQMCGDAQELESLGLVKKPDGRLVDKELKPQGMIGSRNAIVNDLSPAATLIAAGYNLTTDSSAFPRLAANLLEQFNKQYGWMYQTTDLKSGDVCNIDFTVWSEIFSCPDCSGELVFWDIAYDSESGELDANPKCPHCSAEVNKRSLVRRTTSYFDKIVGSTRTKQLLRPVEIRYQHRGAKKTKAPDDADFDIIRKVEQLLDEVNYPTELFMFTPEGEDWGDLYRGYHDGISRAHDFHLVRQLVAFSLLWHLGADLPTEEMRRLWRFTLQSVVISFTRRNRFLKNAYSQVNRALSGTLYIGSTVSEPSPTYILTGKIKRFSNAIPNSNMNTAVTTQSLSSIRLPDNSVDYVFIDPPFGDNLPYSELNFLWEAWLSVYTNAQQDTVVSGKQKKSLIDYTEMMSACLKQVYRVLKPGRWVTVEFHNSKNAVWTAIQESLGRAGFIIADVSVLDKGMKTKKQMHAKAVDKDLVISAYKPNGGLETRFKLEAGKEEGVWDFMRTHLRQLPVFISKEGQGLVIAERQHVLLFDRMVAYHVQRNVSVPLSASDFYRGVAERFSERDGMYFLPDQVEEYDRKRMTFQYLKQLDLFVSDEASAIQWLRQQLKDQPRAFQDLQPLFMRETQGGWEKHERPLELMVILEQNFLRFDGKGPVPEQIHAYLSTNWKELRNLPKDDPTLVAKARDRWYVPDPNKAGDLEKLREKALLKEFEEYKEVKKKLKVFRLEAVRAGFKKAWQERDYAVIIQVAEKIPNKILEEDPKLLMWYDQAVTRMGGE